MSNSCDDSVPSQIFPSPEPNRLAIVVHRDLEIGPKANAIAIVSGGLQCEAFETSIPDSSGNFHAAIRWNLVVLQAKSNSQLQKLLLAAQEHPVKAVAFAKLGQDLSNSFESYKEVVASYQTQEFELIAVGLFGNDTFVRTLTKSFSILK